MIDQDIKLLHEKIDSINILIGRMIDSLRLMNDGLIKKNLIDIELIEYLKSENKK